MILKRIARILRHIIIPIALMPLPSRLKIWFFQKTGNTIGKECYIGFSLMDTNELILGDHVFIGHFNILRGLKTLRLDTGSRISHFNWVTGGATGSFTLGRNSSMSICQYCEAYADITIGSNTIIAGRSSEPMSFSTVGN